MKNRENNYQRLKNIENETILLLSKNKNSSQREKIETLKSFIDEVIENVDEAKNGEMDDLLKFLYGYDSSEMITTIDKQLDELKKLVKDGEKQ